MLIGRPGYTVVEMLIALAIGMLVIGLGAAIGLRHQRFQRDLVIAVERSEQLGQIVAVMPISIRSISPGEGDIAPGAARDTSLEFRATIMSGVVCDTSAGAAFLAPFADSPRLASLLTHPETGDTAWVLSLSDTGERWVARPIGAVSDIAHECGLGGTRPFGAGNKPSLELRISPLPPPGTPVRITRPWRYSLYKASDGGWYVGAKDWNPASARFNTIQPVAGPFVSAAGSGLRFQYSDSLGVLLPSGLADPKRIALVEVSLRVDSVLPGKYAHAIAVRSRSGSAIAIRNRWR